eukprot:1348180-Amorphochlora_amoeboformis.AAC.1
MNGSNVVGRGTARLCFRLARREFLLMVTVSGKLVTRRADEGHCRRVPEVGRGSALAGRTGRARPAVPDT